jgi:hypothetical protein
LFLNFRLLRRRIIKITTSCVAVPYLWEFSFLPAYTVIVLFIPARPEYGGETFL